MPCQTPRGTHPGGRSTAASRFNGDGREAETRLIGLSRRRAEIERIGLSAPAPPPSLELTLAQGVSKGERTDSALQKATETAPLAAPAAIHWGDFR